MRKVARADVLYAIRNVGFSGAIMPANIVTGREARAIADFLAEYSGKEADEQDDVVAPGREPAAAGPLLGAA